MPKEYAISRIYEAEELGVKHVVFTGGEPTLHPHFLEIFREVKKHGMSVLLVTNGIPFRDSVLEEYTRYDKSSFYVSLDCFDEKTNDKYRDKGAFRYVVEIIRKIREIDKNKFIGVNSILVKDTLKSLPKTAEFVLNELKANVLNVERVIRVGNSETMPNEWMIDNIQEYFEVINKLKEQYKNRFRSYTCDLNSCLLNTLSSFNVLIYPDKNIYLCCNLPDKRMKIGDENKSLKKTLNKNNISKIGDKINKYFFEKSQEVRFHKGIFGCVECVEEYKKLKGSGKLDQIFNNSKSNLWNKILKIKKIQ